jgi:hypothetical protein
LPSCAAAGAVWSNKAASSEANNEAVIVFMISLSPLDALLDYFFGSQAPVLTGWMGNRMHRQHG